MGLLLVAPLGGHLTKAYTFDGSNDALNTYSTDLNGVFSPTEGTLIVWAKVSGSGVWSDSTTRYLARLTADTSNEINLVKLSTPNNSIRLGYEAGVGSQTIDTTLSTTDWFQVAATWSKSSDEVKLYVNGSQVGTTQTGLGTWVGNLASTTTAIGANGSAGGLPWSGMINDVRLYSQVLTSAQILTLYTGSTTTRDTSTTYNSTTGSAKIVGASDQITNFTQSLNVGDTNSYNLSAYAYTSGAAVTSSDAQLFYNGSAISTTYTSVGGGWYQLTGTVTGANESRTYGVQVKAGKTVYLDNISVNNYPSSGSLTSNIFDSGQGSNWGTLTYSATTPTNTTVAVKARTSNSSTMSGADDFSTCSAITSGSDISSNGCVTDTDRYIQYQVTLSSSDLLRTPTFQDVSITFETSDDAGPTFELDSPGDNHYTNEERPTFRWKAATDVSSTVTDYNLTIDNPSLGSGNPTGDFIISDIPVSRTEDYVTSKYTVRYDGFSDSDQTNNYISVYTKSSNDWSTDSTSGENDGKLREGKVVWTVKATDSAGNETTHSRTLFVDRTNPKTSISQINGVQVSDSMSTTDKTPTFYGKVIDPLSGGDSSVTQTENGPRVASGPKQVEIKIEKKQGLVYLLHTSYLINADKSWYTCGDTLISDNSKQKCDKYIPFEYTQKNDLDLGTYKVTVTGKDNADNTSSSSFELKVTTYSQITTTEEKEVVEKEITSLPTEQQEEVKETLEITKPTEPSEPSVVSKAGEAVTEAGGNLLSSIGNLLNGAGNLLVNFGGGVVYVFKNVTSATGNAIAWITTGTWNALTTIASGVGNGLAGLARFTGNSIAYVASVVGNTVGFVAQTTGRAITAVANSIGSGYNWIAQSAPGVIGDAMTAMGDATVGVGRAISSTSTNIANVIGSVTTDTGRSIGQLATNTGRAIGDTSIVIGNGVKSLVVGTGNIIGSSISSIGNGMGSIARSTADSASRIQRATTEGATNVAFVIGEKAQNVSGGIGLAIIKFTYNFVPEPTTISDVKVAKSTPTTMTITWTTNHPATSKVNYGLTPDYGQDVQFTKRVTHHEVTITGLQPNTTYSYEVMSQNKNYVYDANHMFTTPSE